MANSFIINIPVSPYILKYASVRYGQPFRLNNRCLLGTVIRSLLSQPEFYTNMNLSDRNIRYSFYTEKFKVIVPISMWYHVDHAVSEEHAIQINRFLEDEFEERLHIFVSQNSNEKKRRCGYNLAVEKFASFYNLEETDISEDGLLKMHYRFRKRQEKNRQKVLRGMSGQIHPVPAILL